MADSSENLPDPDQKPDADVVIYDGQCRFCQSQVRRLRKLDFGGDRLAFLSLHDPRVVERYPELSHDELMKQMYIIADGQHFGGSDAVKYLSRRLPVLWAAAPILHLPGTAGLWRWGYRQIAKRRYRLAGKDCGDDACEVHLG